MNRVSDFFLDTLAGLIALAVLFAFVAVAFGDEHGHPPQDEAMHDKFYSSWFIPPNRSRSCCNKQDCYPTEIKRIGGQWHALRREDGEWIPFSADLLEENQGDSRDSPDGRSHVCMQAPGYYDYVFCAVRGSGQ